MQSYLGRMISTALPRSSNSRLSPYTTSANPPTLATGASSGVIITTNIAGLAGAGGGGDSPSFTGSGSGPTATAGPRRISFSGIGTAGTLGDRNSSAGRDFGAGNNFVAGWDFTGTESSFTSAVLALD